MFGALNPEKIWNEQLIHLSALQHYHFTVKKSKNVSFNSIVHTYFLLFTIRYVGDSDGEYFYKAGLLAGNKMGVFFL